MNSQGMIDRYLVLALICSFCHSVTAAPIDFHWAIAAETAPFTDMQARIASDRDGNCYVTGRITSTNFQFGGIPVSNPSGSTGCMWVAKVDRTGRVMWVFSPSSDGYSEGRGIGVDQGGNVYVTGTYAYKSLILAGESLPVSGATDVFLTKFSPSGNLTWAKHSGGNDSDYATGLSVDPEGNCFITGHFYSSVMLFDQKAVTLSSSGATDMFLAKYTTTGNPLWARSFGSGRAVAGSGVATDTIGNVYATGFFEGSLSIDSYTISAGAPPARNPFVMKFGPDGAVKWASPGSGTGGGSYGECIAVDETGHTYIAGFFEANRLSFGVTAVNKTSGIQNLFLAKFNPSGAPMWLKGVGNQSYARGSSVAVDARGSAYVAGYFGGDVLSFESLQLTNSGSSDGFLVKYDAQGTALWGRSIGGRSSDMASGVAVQNTDQLYISGSFRSSDVTLGRAHLSNTTQGAQEGSSAFLARLDDQLPEPRRATATAQIVNGFVVGIVIRDPGFGYTSTPTITIAGGGGLGARAVAVQSAGLVTSITIENPGSGYTSTPTVTISPPPMPPRKAVASASVVNGFVVGFNLTDVGAGYDTPPAVLLIGGGGTGATAVATVVNGVVTGISITNPGAGYTSAPRVQIASPPFSPRVGVSVSKVRVTMEVVLGRRYQLESSTDMSTWSPSGTPFVAQDELLTQEFEVDVTGRFFRINQVP